MTALPELEPYIRALRNAFNRIDGDWLLPDELKDQRKYEVLSDTVGQLCGVWDAGTLEEIYRIAFDDGLDRARVIEVVDGACERATVAVQYRAENGAPARRRAKRDPRQSLPQATLDALDWIMCHAPAEYDAFLARHDALEASLIVEYIEQKQKGGSHGG